MFLQGYIRSSLGWLLALSLPAALLLSGCGKGEAQRPLNGAPSRSVQERAESKAPAPPPDDGRLCLWLLWSKDPAHIKEVRKALKDGVPFVTAARRLSQSHPKQVNVNADCADPASLDPAMREAAEGLGLGQVSAPFVFQKGDALVMRTTDFYRKRGRELYSQGKYAQAERLLLKDLALQPVSSNTLHLLALARTAQGNLRGALKALDQALVWTPDDPGLLNDKASTLVTLGQKQEALPLFERAMKLAPGNPMIMSNLAWALALNKHDLARAETLARRAVETEPDAPELWNTLGLVQQARGEEAAAVVSLHKAARLDPRATETQKRLLETMMSLDSGTLAKMLGQKDMEAVAERKLGRQVPLSREEEAAAEKTHIKPTPKVTTAPQPRPEPVAKPEAAPKPAPEAKPEAAPKPKAMAKPAPKPAPEAKPASVAMAQAKPMAEPMAAPKPEARPTPEANPAPVAMAKPEARPRAESKPAPAAKPAPQGQSETVSQPMPKPGPGSITKIEPKVNKTPEATAQAKPMAAPKPAPEAKPAPETMARAKPKPKPKAMAKPAPKPAPAARPAPETVARPAAKAATEAGPTAGRSAMVQFLQVSTYQDPAMAAKEVKGWSKMGLEVQQEPWSNGKGKTWQRVLLGPYRDRATALAMAHVLQKAGLIKSYSRVEREIAAPLPPEKVYLQVASFRSEKRSLVEERAWVKRGYRARRERWQSPGGKVWQRVLLGPLTGRPEALRLGIKLNAQRLSAGFRLITRPVEPPR